jgi:hypothetical protein
VLYQAEPRPDEKAFRGCKVNAAQKGLTQQFYTSPSKIRASDPERLFRAKDHRNLRAQCTDPSGRKERRPQNDNSCRLVQIPPVRPNAHVDLQGHGQSMHFLHVLADQRLHDFDLALGNFEDEFVMHLQRHA